MKLPTWAYVIVLITVIGTLAFDCTAPLPAAAAIAGLTLKRDEAIVTSISLWLATQLLGFAIMGYPLEPQAFGWGAVIGLATVSAAITTSLHRKTYMALVAFVVYELVILGFALVFGGTETFAPYIVGGLFLVNLIGFGVLALGWLMTKELRRNFSNV